MRSREKAYEILSIRDFGNQRKNVKVLVFDHTTSRDQQKRIPATIWQETAMTWKNSLQCSFCQGWIRGQWCKVRGGCMNAKGCYLTSPL